MLTEIDLKSPELQQALNRFLPAGHQQTVSIRLQSYGEDLQTLDLPNSISTGRLPTDPPAPASALAPEVGQNQSLRDSCMDSESVIKSDPIYLIASYTKVVHNLLMLLVVKKEDGIGLDSCACAVYDTYRLRRTDRSLPVVRLPRNPTIRQLLCHVNGFSPMSETLFAADGTSLLTIDEFLRIAPKATEEYYKTSNISNDGNSFEYSNANHIFAAVIIEVITGLSFSNALYDLLLEPLSMNQSTLDPNTLKTVPGFQFSSSNIQHPVNVHRMSGDVVETASMGLRSSPGDIVRFNNALICALQGDPNSFITHDDAKSFFVGQGMSLAGYTFGILTDEPSLEGLESESPNRFLSHKTHQLGGFVKSHKFSKTVRKLALPDRSHDEDYALKDVVHHKSGYFDGYSCAVFLIPRQRTFLIVMGNSTGPLDTTYYISRYLLQELFGVIRPVDVYAEAVEAQKVCSRNLAGLERRNLLRSNQAVERPDLAGIYRRDVTQEQITITQDGNVFFHGRVNKSSSMKVVQVSDTTIRVLLTQPLLTLEGWSTWANMDFHVQRNGNRVSLVRQLTEEQQHTYHRIIE